jgi:hypothetical protein
MKTEMESMKQQVDVLSDMLKILVSEKSPEEITEARQAKITAAQMAKQFGVSIETMQKIQQKLAEKPKTRQK